MDGWREDVWIITIPPPQAWRSALPRGCQCKVQQTEVTSGESPASHIHSRPESGNMFWFSPHNSYKQVKEQSLSLTYWELQNLIDAKQHQQIKKWDATFKISTWKRKTVCVQDDGPSVSLLSSGSSVWIMASASVVSVVFGTGPEQMFKGNAGACTRTLRGN